MKEVFSVAVAAIALGLQQAREIDDPLFIGVDLASGDGFSGISLVDRQGRLVASHALYPGFDLGAPYPAIPGMLQPRRRSTRSADFKAEKRKARRKQQRVARRAQRRGKKSS